MLGAWSLTLRAENMHNNQCPGCLHYRGLFKCEAFPDGIPSEILTGTFDHSQPHPDDQGIQYERIGDMDGDTDEQQGSGPEGVRDGVG